MRYLCGMTSKRIENKEGKGVDRATKMDMAMNGDSAPHPSQTNDMFAMNSKIKEGKIGHRRVDAGGQVTYKKRPTSELMAAIQLGIGQSVGSMASRRARDVLLQDFSLVESVFYPGAGSNSTPAHHYSDFRFKTYAPIAFRHFRDLFHIRPDNFLMSMCNEPLIELSNPGASGSIFYMTNDDEFIIKTIQHREADFLQELLPGYYMNLNQNPRTLLPKFFGLYCYQCLGKNIRLCVMNNLLPSSVKMHEKYDLKGSTYKRQASQKERAKKSPTYKDLDFMEMHPDGILLEADTYSALMKTIDRDCLVLQSFKIMDYSLLLGVHNLDKAAREKESQQQQLQTGDTVIPEVSSLPANLSRQTQPVQRARSMKPRLQQYSTALEAIQATVEPTSDINNDDVPDGGIPARNAAGDRLLLYIGIIDVLQCYRAKKQLEHTFKSMLHDGDTISVHNPVFYAQRFQKFLASTVFRKIPSPAKPVSPVGKKRSHSIQYSRAQRPSVISEMSVALSLSEPAMARGRPDVLPECTPVQSDAESAGRASSCGDFSLPPHHGLSSPSNSQPTVNTVTTVRAGHSANNGGELLALTSSLVTTGGATPVHTSYTISQSTDYAADSVRLSDVVVNVKVAVADHLHHQNPPAFSSQQLTQEGAGEQRPRTPILSTTDNESYAVTSDAESEDTMCTTRDDTE